MSSSTNNNHPHTSSNDEGEEEDDDLDSDDDELPELVDLANIGNETDDETVDDEQTDSDDIRVTVLPDRLLIPLQIWDDEEEASEEESNGSISNSIHTGETLQQRDRSGWNLGTRGMNNRYLRNEARGDNFIARIISQHPCADLPSHQLYSSSTASFILRDGLRRYYRQDMGLTNTEFSALYRRVRYYQRDMDLTDYEFMRHLYQNPELIHRFIHARERNENEEKDDDEQKEDNEE
ncbi:predicted protein [Chaetoceros tenuissimus]|uniref:Uncharacterized protein n=1 Tax=Chaetoceros tenuissimus TaxID=426638 RepID=A0AAD3CU80_9STRA|nr:predicted protein [Chaetoceros tenuissimus]